MSVKSLVFFLWGFCIPVMAILGRAHDISWFFGAIILCLVFLALCVVTVIENWEDDK